MISKSPYPAVALGLDAAREAIRSSITPLPAEEIPVVDGLHRVSAVSLAASRPKPSYDQSTRDGFALAQEPLSTKDGTAVFTITAEIAAGCTDDLVLRPGEAARIMTGAMVPRGCVRVVPFEVCHEETGQVAMSSAELSRSQLFIRFCGSDLQPGEELVASGVQLLPEHLLGLAENGCRRLSVHERPDVAVLCTGSELVDPGTAILPGQKVSGNGILLASLLISCGADCTKILTVTDRVDDIVHRIRQLTGAGMEMIITTGGMGPGKYDLMEQVFARLGGELVYNRLRVRPGKSTLFGMIDRVPFFALPGPPPAVRLLFHELVAPAVYRLQGRQDSPALVNAVLDTLLPLKKSGQLHLKGGVAGIVHGELHVRLAQQREAVNAIVHLGDNNETANEGPRVRIRLVGPLQELAG